MRAHATAHTRLLVIGLAVLALAPLLWGCGAAEEEPKAPPIVAEGEHDPAVWGAVYPQQYARWLATAEERPAGKSAYKRGFDGGVMYDKLSEFPFMPLLFNGWGFGIEYNEPRGHHYMLIDQKEIDPARVKAGGACLTCKSPYAEDLYERDRDALFSATYAEATAMIPEKDRELGATCIDCHDNATMELDTRRWTADAALAEIGVEPGGLSLQQSRLMVCGQCHCTYSVMKEGTASVDVDFPWEGGAWGDITVEDIIDNLEEQDARHEWTQAVTGLKLGFIRHPDVEYYTAGSAHFTAGVSCADCHMPDREIDNKTVSDHNLMSPLKADMVACKRCHTASAEEMRAKVIEIQDANLGRFIDAGYRVATAAKLIETANASLETSAADIKPAYDAAVADYRQAFYRVLYMGAENSVGFHNPAEGTRILGDAVSYADKADAALRKLLASKGVSVPAEMPLELRSYTEDRGVKKLDFVREHYIADPTGAAQKQWPASLAALLQ